MFRKGYEQHDCAEFTRVLLDQIEMASKGTLENKHLASGFIGKIKSEVVCQTCKNKSNRSDNFVDL
jgi:hypothetical protein